MNSKDFRPAGDYASTYGFKAVIYGPPGTGKTPIVNTAPRPVLLATEPGLLSMRGSKVPTCLGTTTEAIEDFFKWAFHSNETKNFDTIAVDSISQLCEIYLLELLSGKSKGGNKVHGQAAYGEMAKLVMPHLRGLFHLQNKHTYLIAKQEIKDTCGIPLKRPFFPGKYLPVEIPHLYDAILQLDTQSVPSVGQVRAFRCSQSIDVTARDRSGRLAEFEFPDFGALVTKAMA